MLGLHTLCRHAPGLSQWHAPDNRHGGRHSNVTIDDPAPRANLVGTGWERWNWYMTFFLGPFLEVFRGLFLNQSSAPWGNQGPARAILIFPGGAASQSRAGLAHQKSSSGISTAYDESPEPRMSPQAFPASPTGSLGPAQTLRTSASKPGQGGRRDGQARDRGALSAPDGRNHCGFGCGPVLPGFGPSSGSPIFRYRGARSPEYPCSHRAPMLASAPRTQVT